MDKAQYVHKRKGKYMAQVLEAFERDIEPNLPSGMEGETQSFKGLVRARINALASDSVDIMALDGSVPNGAAQDLRDRLHPTGRP